MLFRSATQARTVAEPFLQPGYQSELARVEFMRLAADLLAAQALLDLYYRIDEDEAFFIIMALS